MLTKNYILLLILHLTAIHLLSQGYRIDQYHVEINITDQGSLNVEEHIEVTFLENRRGIYRDIPTRYQYNSRNLYFKISKIKVSDRNYKVISYNDQKRIRIGHPDKYLTGNQSYQIKYEVKGAIMTHDDYHDLVYNIIGTGWDVPIEKATFRIRFPDSWQDRIKTYQCKVGQSGTINKSLPLHVSSTSLSFDTGYRLDTGEGITLAFDIPHELLPPQKNSTAVQTKKPWQNSWWALIPAGILTWLLSLWKRYGSNPPLRYDEKDIPLQYEPPIGMSPAEVGTFFDYRVNKRDLISLLPHWAQQDLLTITAIDGVRKDYLITKIGDPNERDLPSYELHYFNQLFRLSTKILLSDLQYQMSSTMTGTAFKIVREIKGRKLYDQRALLWFHSHYSIIAMICLLPLIIGSFFMSNIVLALCFITVLIALLIIYFMEPRYSEKGKTYHEHLQGYYNFLADPNPEKLKELTDSDSTYLHRAYPYVVAFGLDEIWAEMSAIRSHRSPSWYMAPHLSDDGSLSFHQFSNDFDNRAIQKVLYSSPNSSSSGGSNGNSASVGGGFGGGGGGSW